jgi:hypothetical protein
MKLGVRGFVLSICVVAVTLLGGAGGSSASTTTKCSTPAPSGRLFCVTVEDIDGVSPSGHVGSGARQADVEAYQFYKLTIANTSGSSLTNGTLSVVLTDNVGTSPGVTSTAVYIPSSATPFCASASTTPNLVTCQLGNLAAGSSTPEIVLGYRTSTTPGVTSTDAAVTVAFKEGSNGPNGANPATLSFTENTSLEPDPEASVAWSPSAQNVQMGTSPTFDSQWSTLQYTVPPGKAAFLADMSEGVDDLCPSVKDGVNISKCFDGAEKVTTALPADVGTFSQTNPFHLTININQNLITGNLDNVKMIHRGGSGTEVISLHCAHTPPLPTDTLPCITVAKNPNAKTDVIGAYGFQNGGWVPGI